MGFFEDELPWEMFLLQYNPEADFYLSSFQSSESTFPLLILRPILLLISISATGYSQGTYIKKSWFKWWFIYLTHWGMITVVVTSALAVFVSIMATIREEGYDDDDDDISWYVKIYWVLYNIATSSSLLITSFYWTILHECEDDEDILLALCGHGMNTVVMLTHLFSSQQPSRLLHFIHPCLFCIAWSCFSVIHYVCHGTNVEGKRYVYSVVDWSKPLPTAGIVAGTAMALCVFHLLVVAMAALRNWIRSKLIEDSE